MQRLTLGTALETPMLDCLGRKLEHMPSENSLIKWATNHASEHLEAQGWLEVDLHLRELVVSASQYKHSCLLMIPFLSALPTVMTIVAFLATISAPGL